MSSSVSEKAAHNCDVNEIRSVILSFLSRCGLRWPTVEYDQAFDTLCRTDAVRRGYPMDGPRSLEKFIPMGVVMATTAYAHLTNKSTQVFIAHYTASLIYIDDSFQHDVDAARYFNEKFVQKKPHGDRVLDCFAELLLELPNHFSGLGSNMVTTSTMNLVTAMTLEYETQGMTIRPVAYRYPEFARVLAGATEAYAIFVFPPELALQTFIQSIPELMIYLGYGNDILSFLKEEFAGETVNYISLLASQRRVSKYEALSQVADVIVDAHNRTLEILKFHEGALEAYMKFATGYLGFHAGCPRYKLGELGL